MVVELLDETRNKEILSSYTRSAVFSELIVLKMQITRMSYLNTAFIPVVGATEMIKKNTDADIKKITRKLLLFKIQMIVFRCTALYIRLVRK